MLVTLATARSAALPTNALERRTLDLRGKTESTEVLVITAQELATAGRLNLGAGDLHRIACPYRPPIGDRTFGGVASAHRSATLPDMFNRHRTSPDPTRRAPARDDRGAVALLDRTDAPGVAAAAVRARLTASASVGLRDRLARPALATQR